MPRRPPSEPLDHGPDAPPSGARSRTPRGLRGLRILLALGVALAVLLPSAVPALTADPIVPPAGLTMTGRAMMDGHVRSGAWFAIAVDLENSGPAIVGELRVAGGSASRTRFGTAVELATGSRKRYLLYAQPPDFGGNVTVTLVGTDGRPVAEATVALAIHDQTQLVVGVVSENPARIVGQLDLLPSQTGSIPVIVPLSPDRLPERLEAWAVLDRLVWQDVDTTQLTPAQLAALRGWVAGGGRLVIAGGTAGPDILTGLPEDLLPYRPTAVRDVDPETLRTLLGGLPEGAAPLTALAGDEGRGRVLARSGDRVIAADLAFGSGTVALLGFDPATSWIAAGDAYDTPLWRRYLTPRSGSTVGLQDDSQILSAVANLPALALPPIGGIVVLLIGYIVLVGPVNYLVLRWLDRREWAWLTVPALIAVFTAGAFGFGAALRGSDVILHEVAIVRGAAGTDAALAQAYLGVFSPSRGTYQLRAPNGALLASPISGDIFGGDVSGPLDVLQGEPSRVRDLTIGFGSLRAVRADTPTVGPVVTADLRLEGARLKGTVTNRSDRPLVGPAIVLGNSAVRLADIPPGGTGPVDLALVANPWNQPSLSDRVVGQVFWGGDRQFDEETQRALVRRSLIDQLSWDPWTGFNQGLGMDVPVLLAWGTEPVVSVDVDGRDVRRVSNVLYQVPLSMRIRGDVVFRNDLLRSTVLEVNANFFNKDPWTMGFGVGTVQIGYRPIAVEGTFQARRVIVAMNFGGDPGMIGDPKILEPEARCDPALDELCEKFVDGLPDFDVLDRRTGEWVQFPHLGPNAAYALADPGRWIDPATGELQVRFVNERQEGIGFQFHVQLEGSVG